MAGVSTEDFIALHEAIQTADKPDVELKEVFATLIKFEKKILLCSNEVRIRYWLALATCYISFGRYIKAIEVLNTTVKQTTHHNWDLKYRVHELLCLCSFYLRDVEAGTLAFDALIKHIADIPTTCRRSKHIDECKDKSRTGSAIIDIFMNMSRSTLDKHQGFEAWIKEHVPIVGDAICAVQSREDRSVIKKKIDILFRLTNLKQWDEALAAAKALSEDDVKQLNDEATMNHLVIQIDCNYNLKRWDEAARICYQSLETKMGHKQIEVQIHYQSHLCLCECAYFTQNADLAAKAHRELMEFYHKHESFLRRNRGPLVTGQNLTPVTWSAKHPGCHEWMMTNAPTYRAHYELEQREKEQLAPVDLTENLLIQRQLELDRARAALLEKERAHVQPTFVVEKKEIIPHVGKKKHNTARGKRHKRRGETQPSAPTPVGAGTRLQPIPPPAGDAVPFSRDKESKLSALRPLDVPMPLPSVGVASKPPKVEKKRPKSLQVWLSET